MLKILRRRLWLLLFLLQCAALPILAYAETVPPANWPPIFRYELTPKWITQTPDGKVSLNWPPNDGCAAAPITVTLPPGFLIDRFGAESGSYFSPRGESYAGRAVPYVCSRMAYTVYRVVQPINVASCKAAAWFDQPGGATQFKADQPALALRNVGAITPVPNDAPSLCDGS